MRLLNLIHPHSQDPWHDWQVLHGFLPFSGSTSDSVFPCCLCDDLAILCVVAFLHHFGKD